MITGVYIWLNYYKTSGSHSSHLDWVGKIDVEVGKKAINKFTLEDVLKRQSSAFFSHDVICSATMQEIATGKVLYRRHIGRVK